MVSRNRKVKRRIERMRRRFRKRKFSKEGRTRRTNLLEMAPSVSSAYRYRDRCRHRMDTNLVEGEMNEMDDQGRQLRHNEMLNGMAPSYPFTNLRPRWPTVCRATWNDKGAQWNSRLRGLETNSDGGFLRFGTCGNAA